MKILLFTEIFDCGGADTFIINLINHWPNEDDEFTLISNWNYPGMEIIEKNLKRPCEIIRHQIPIYNNFLQNKKGRIVNICKKIMLLISRHLFLIYNIFALRKLLLQGEPDRLMVINGGYPGGDSCRAAGIAWGLFSKKTHSIHNFHNLAMKSRWPFLIQEFLIDMLLNRFTKVFVTVSRASAESMVLRPAIYNHGNVTYIYNGIDIPEEHLRALHGDIKSEIGISQSSPLCLMLGTYEARKGHYFLFQAFKKVLSEIPTAHLLICGYGFPEEIVQVRKFVKEFDLEQNVHLMDFRTDISNLLLGADVLVVASQSFESFGFTSVEAMAHRVPVVATNVGGIPEVVINGEGGYCVDRNDVDSYSMHIINLLKDENLRKEMGEKGFQRYKNFFTAKRMSSQYAELILSPTRYFKNVSD